MNATSEYRITKGRVYEVPQVGEPTRVYTTDEFAAIMNAPDKGEEEPMATTEARLNATAGKLSDKVRALYALGPGDPEGCEPLSEVAPLVDEYLNWYESPPRYPEPGTPKYDQGVLIWDKVDELKGLLATLLASKVRSPSNSEGHLAAKLLRSTTPPLGGTTQEDDTMGIEVGNEESYEPPMEVYDSPERELLTFEDEEMGQPNNQEAGNGEVTPPKEGNQMEGLNVRTLIKTSTYGALSDKVNTLIDRAPDDPEVQHIARAFWAHWNQPWSDAKRGAAAGMHRYADRILASHRTFSEKVGSGADAFLDGVFRVMDRSSEVFGKVAENSAKNVGTVMGATLKGASGGAREFQSARMELAVANATDKHYATLRGQYEQVRLDQFAAKLQRKAARRMAMDAVKAMAKDASSQ